MSNEEDVSSFKYKWKKWSLTDVVIILFIGVVGVVIPTTILDDIEGWQKDFPGQIVNLTFTHNVTGITYNSTVFLKDPSYDREKVEETITSNDLFALSAVLPPSYILLYLFILSKVKPNKAFKQFKHEWIWWEYITFGYAFAISMSINYWLNKSLKILVSMPIPDFYQRCGLDTSDLNNLSCTSTDDNEVLKSFKSFPSGHSSNLFTAGTLLVLYTWNKLNLYDTLKFEFLEHRWYYRSFIDFLLLWPIFLASWGATTRVTDHVHTPTDILGGACLGYVAGYIGYYSQYMSGSPWSYRLLIWPEIRNVIEQHKTLKRNMYPQLFQHRTNALLQEMTKYRFEERSNRRQRGSSRGGNNTTSAEMARITDDN